MSCIRDADECRVGEGDFGGFIRREDAFGDELLHDFPGLLLTRGAIAGGRGRLRSGRVILILVHCLARVAAAPTDRLCSYTKSVGHQLAVIEVLVNPTHNK
ncbi:hypothetical protein [Bacteroides sp. f07]|uniref:hypothetical protein n=1 Tax=Bacteroides sp. f07 TaxID=3132704 RepID=UPI0036F3F2F9